jgi:hypothetical protein
LVEKPDGDVRRPANELRHLVILVCRTVGYEELVFDFIECVAGETLAIVQADQGFEMRYAESIATETPVRQSRMGGGSGVVKLA